jgi:HlyD family secretion protein
MTSKPTSSSPSPRSPRGRNASPLRRFIPYAIGAALLLALVAGFWPKAVRVETAIVSRGPLVVSVFEEGKTRIRHRYVVSAPAAGALQRVEFRAGAPIVAGQTVLATIEPAGLDPRTQAQAEAQLHAAEAAKQSRAADVQRVSAALDLARKEVARAEPLFRSGAIAAQDWDVIESRALQLGRELNATEFALRVADFEIAQARAALLQGGPRQPGEGVEPLRILAPIDGFVLNVFEESARVVAPGQPIMEVGDPHDLEAEVELLSSDAVAVAPGADVSIEEWGGEQPLRGRVSLVERAGFTKYSALGVEEQRVKVRVDLVEPTPPGHELGDRYRVEARIVTWRGDEVLQLPTGALFRRGGDWMIFVVEDGTARLRKVEIAHNNGIAAEVLAGVPEGATVIVHPADQVRDGVSVTTEH